MHWLTDNKECLLRSVSNYGKISDPVILHTLGGAGKHFREILLTIVRHILAGKKWTVS